MAGPSSTSKDSPTQQAITPAAKPGVALPPGLKGGIETLSGVSMADVTVHYNSPLPAALNAHAFARGTEIHVAPGQERHLAHEAWHIVQQKQGAIKPRLHANSDADLSKEADVMGAKAVTLGDRL
ncbi:eCIS core domain-containing protein [Aliidongia dinghuensis]|nr:DUF4157 domain-containing protein [Aliidongia dinghuensis]